jgi:acyl-CoA thioesterase-1
LRGPPRAAAPTRYASWLLAARRLLRRLRECGRYGMGAALAAACAIPAALAASPPAPTPTVILAFGDSFTAGLGLQPKYAFPAQLEAKLLAQRRAVRVINGGVSGETTAGGLARVDRVLADKPDWVILELGANDALRGIQPVITEENLNAIINKFEAAHARILLMGMRAPPNWGEAYEAAFDRIYPDLARNRRVPLYPFFLQDVALNPRLNQPDTLHPNEQGVVVLVDHIAPIIAHLIDDQAGEKPR